MSSHGGVVMSSVNSASDRNSTEDGTRRVRESYQNKETETNKKHSQELKHITEAHQEEIERLKKDHTAELEDLKERTRDAISGRDMKYQKEIEDLRDFHQKQLMRTAQEAETKEARTEKALKEDSSRLAHTSEQQKKLMRNAYEEQLRSKDRGLEEFGETAKAKQNESQNSLRTRLNQAHETELSSVVKDRDNRISGQKQEMEDYRRAKDATIKMLEHKELSERERLLNEHSTDIHNVQADNKQNLDSERDQFDRSLQKNRERYDKALRQKADEGQEARENLADTVTGRYGKKLSQVESELRNAKAENERMRVRDMQQKSVELGDLRDAMQNNIEHLEESRRGVVDASNKKTHSEIDRVNKSHDIAITSTNRFYQDKLAEENLRQGERLSEKEADFSRTFSHEKTSNESRFERLKSTNDLEQGKMRGYFEKATSSMKDNFETALKEMRERNRKDQEIIFSSVSKQAQENDAKFQNRLTQLTTSYERQLADLQDKHQKELKDQMTGSDRQKHEMEKKAATDMTSQSAQYEYRLSKMQDAHKQEIKSLQVKHEESLANLTRNRQA
jgi:hypothetical protein